MSTYYLFKINLKKILLSNEFGESYPETPNIGEGGPECILTTDTLIPGGISSPYAEGRALLVPLTVSDIVRPKKYHIILICIMYFFE